MVRKKEFGCSRLKRFRNKCLLRNEPPNPESDRFLSDDLRQRSSSSSRTDKGRWALRLYPTYRLCFLEGWSGNSNATYFLSADEGKCIGQSCFCSIKSDYRIALWGKETKLWVLANQTTATRASQSAPPQARARVFEIGADRHLPLSRIKTSRERDFFVKSGWTNWSQTSKGACLISTPFVVLKNHKWVIEALIRRFVDCLSYWATALVRQSARESQGWPWMHAWMHARFGLRTPLAFSLNCGHSPRLAWRIAWRIALRMHTPEHVQALRIL